MFAAAIETPIRELRQNLVPITRLALGLVLFTIVIVAVVAQTLVPAFGWAAAFTLGAIVAPTDAIAATTVFRRLRAPRIVETLIEGEGLFNDATALVAYRAALAVAIGGTFVLVDTVFSFGIAVVGGIAMGLLVGWLGARLLSRLDEPTVEVIVSFVIPFAAYLPAEALHLSGVLAAVTAGLVIGSQLGRILTARSRILWLGSWKMMNFVLNGFVFLLIGLELPTVADALAGRAPMELATVVVGVCVAIVVTRFVWAYLSSQLPNSPYRQLRGQDTVLAGRVRFIVSWAGLRGAVSLAAALALPQDFPERSLILLITFAVIMVTLVGQGLTLPWLVRRATGGVDAHGLDGVEPTLAREVAYQAGLAEVERQREVWPDHVPLLDRLQSGLEDRSQHLATDDADETAERSQERMEHEQIQLTIINAQRSALIELRDSRRINDQTLRQIERELDLEELRMEG